MHGHGHALTEQILIFILLNTEVKSQDSQEG
jgi:hypothetical protein